MNPCHGGEIQSAELQTLEFHPVEFYDMSISDHVYDDHVLERSRRNLMALHVHQHGHPAANAAATLASMCPRDSPAIFNSTASASCLPPDHGPGTTTRTSSGCSQEGFAKASTEAFGSRADDRSRPKGPKCRLPAIAVLRSSQPLRSLRGMLMELGCIARCATFVSSTCRRREAPAVPRRSRTWR